ncbi:MAG: nuclear transport factor 2 family protein [Pseudomonadota bacterium]
MTDTQAAAEHVAIQRVMLDYARGVDERDMALYRACFADDVEIVGFGAETVRGGDAWVAQVEGMLDGFVATQHLLSPMRIDIEGDTARTSSNVQAWHHLKSPADHTLTLWACYESVLQKRDGRWRLTRHELVSRGRELRPLNP